MTLPFGVRALRGAHPEERADHVARRVVDLEALLRPTAGRERSLLFLGLILFLGHLGGLLGKSVRFCSLGQPVIN